MEDIVNDTRLPDEGGSPSRQPLSPLDGLLLDELADMWRDRDPVPDGLTDRITFALDVVDAESMTTADLDLELMELQETPLLAVGSRAGGPVGEAVRTVTFGSPSMTVMLSITPEDAGFRIDGWVAPGGERTIDVRLGQETRTAHTDISGRFVLDSVPPGHLQLLLHREPVSGGPTVPVITPALTL